MFQCKCCESGFVWNLDVVQLTSTQNTGHHGTIWIVAKNLLLKLVPKNSSLLLLFNCDSFFSVASQVQPWARQGVRRLDRGGGNYFSAKINTFLNLAGDRVEAGDGGEGPGRLWHRPQGWSSSLPVSSHHHHHHHQDNYYHHHVYPLDT